MHEDEEGAAGEGFDDAFVVDGGCYVVALPVCCCPVQEVVDGGEGDGGWVLVCFGDVSV